MRQLRSLPELRQPQRDRLRQTDRRKHRLEFRQALQPLPAGRSFLILKAVADVTDRAGVAALGRRWLIFPVNIRQIKWQQFGKV